MGSHKQSKWGQSKWDIVQAASALVAKPQHGQAAQKDQGKPETTPKASATPPIAKPRVSVAQPQRRVPTGGLGGAGRASADRDARLGRAIVMVVLAIALIIFGSNYAKLWESPGQRDARTEAERKKAGPVKEAIEKQRIAMERREADRIQSERLAREREAQRKAADDAAARRAREEAEQRRAKEEGKPPPVPAPPNLAETDCQISKPVSVIVPACSAIIAKHNDFAEAYAVRAWALRERNQPERALTDLKRAIELQPKTAANYAQRGLTYIRLRDFDRALADYNKAIELNPAAAGFYNDRGVAYLEIKDYPRAATDFDRALELNPRYLLAYNNRARVRVLASGDHIGAIADLDRAIEINPKYALAFENRALSHLELKDRAKAIADFNTAIELNPRSARALNGRGVAYERQGNRDLAVADYRRALDADPNFSAARENLTRLGEQP